MSSAPVLIVHGRICPAIFLGFLLFLGVQVYGSSAGQALAANSSASQTTAQKTYVSRQFELSFDYPASWSVLENQGANPAGTLLNLRLLSREQDIPVLRDYSSGDFGLEVFANPERLALREWLDQHGWPFGASDRSVTATAVAGIPALEIATGRMFAPNRYIYLAARDFIIRLSPLAPESQAILNSFRLNP